MKSTEVRYFPPTWMEIPIYVLAVGALVAITGPNIWRSGCGSDVSRCEYELLQVAGALDRWIVEHRCLPEHGLRALHDTPAASGEPYLEFAPVDPWCNPLRLEPPETGRLSYRLTSSGEDALFDTDDDVVFSPMGE